MGDIVKYGADYMSTLSSGADDELKQIADECDPFSTMPKLMLPSDGTSDIKCVLGEDTLFSKKRVHVFIVFLGARRALWQPEGREAESNSPVCSTGIVTAGTFNRRNDQGVGQWQVEGNEDLPFPFDETPEDAQVEIPCNSCKWNKFESAPHWDEIKQGKGKACSEGRVLALRVAEKVDSMESPTGEEVGIYKYNPDSPLVVMNIPATSISTVRGMCSASTARRIPLSRLVWSFSADKQENGNRSWSVLKADLSGFASPDVIVSLDNDKANASGLFTNNQVESEEPMPF